MIVHLIVSGFNFYSNRRRIVCLLVAIIISLFPFLTLGADGVEDGGGGLGEDVVHRPAGKGLPIELPSRISSLLEPEYFRLGADGQINAITDHLETALLGGKRLRPILCYLAGGMAGVEPEQLCSVACLAEWTHQASLLHDDILDGSEMRRGSPTVWKLTSVNEAVLLGDWLLSEITIKALRDGTVKTANSLLETIQGLVEGELLQREIRRAGTYTEEQWFEVAYKKTGLLFGWSCRSAASCANMPPKVVLQFHDLGVSFARIYQMLDDAGDIRELGEVNLVLLRAARSEGKSPFASDISPKAVEKATIETLNGVRIEIAQLNDSIDAAKVAATKVLRQRGATGYESHQQACYQVFGKLADLLAATAIGK